MFRQKPQPDFAQALGAPYDAWLAALHEEVYLDWYLEIGCRRGRSVAKVASKTIVVDPFFKIETNVIGDKPCFYARQETSDDFFASNFLARNDIKVGFSFLDGMHLIEYLLRDFMNMERNSHPAGAISIHDCCPFSVEMTTRDLENLPKGPWTGDVWKLLPILQRWRPDLHIDVIDCAKTGLVVVSNLDPENETLRRDYDAILAEFLNVKIEDFGVKRYFDSFEYTPAQKHLTGGFGFLDGVKIPNEQRLKLTKISP